MILLDIGLPNLNGIEAARRIRKLSPESKILFVSQESSADMVREALGTGASGYVVKPDAGSELLEAVSAVLRGEQFVGNRFAGHDFVRGSDAEPPKAFRTEECFRTASSGVRRSPAATRWVSILTMQVLLDDLTQFIGAALKAGNAVIVDRDRVTPGRSSSKIAGTWLGYWCRH